LWPPASPGNTQSALLARINAGRKSCTYSSMIAVTISSSLNWSGTLFLTSYLGNVSQKGGVRSARFVQVLAKANAGKVTQPNGRDRQYRRRDSDLGQDRGPDRRMPRLQAGLLHELLGQVHHPRPDPICSKTANAERREKLLQMVRDLMAAFWRIKVP
jgi:hypothetical protein